MMRARGLRRWYFVYQEEKEQLRMSWPVTGGKSEDEDIEVRAFQNLGTNLGCHCRGNGASDDAGRCKQMHCTSTPRFTP